MIGLTQPPSSHHITTLFSGCRSALNRSTTRSVLPRGFRWKSLELSRVRLFLGNQFSSEDLRKFCKIALDRLFWCSRGKPCRSNVEKKKKRDVSRVKYFASPFDYVRTRCIYVGTFIILYMYIMKFYTSRWLASVVSSHRHHPRSEASGRSVLNRSTTCSANAGRKSLELRTLLRVHYNTRTRVACDLSLSRGSTATSINGLSLKTSKVYRPRPLAVYTAPRVRIYPGYFDKLLSYNNIYINNKRR